MKRSTVLRLISLAMLVVAVVFIAYALSHPESGTVFYIGGIRVGVAVWQAFYAVYATVMIGLFAASFFSNRSDRG